MAMPPDKSKIHEDTFQDCDDFDDYDEYGEYVAENIGLSLRKRPSAKQKSAIVKEIKTQNHGEESDIDYDSIFVTHARDCFHPLYFTEPKLFSRVENILRSFLPVDHPMSDDLSLNEEDPPLCIRQLLKKPTVEQLAQVIKAFKVHDPDWCWYDAGEGARKLVLALGHNFPELIKQNSRNKIIFGDKFQDSNNKRPPPVPKAKRDKRGRGILVILAIFLVMLWIFNPFRLSPQNAQIQEDQTTQTTPPPENDKGLKNSKQDDVDKDSLPMTTLENTALPITLVSTEEITLLDKTGKLTIIPTGAIITVESRGSIGTLTTRINGALFVGNEERFAGKVIQK